MNAGWMFLRTEVRRRWRSWLASHHLSCAALATGVPAGIMLGRAAWRVFAGQLGILPVVAVPRRALTAMAAVVWRSPWRPAPPGESAVRPAPATIPFCMMVAGILRSEGWCLAGARCAYHHQRCTCLPSGGPRPRYARTG
jgi:hypothetical protein